MGDDRTVDVVILGGGLAGLSLARQLLLETERTVLLVERRESLPPEKQKVGESLVQLAGFYFSKVLDLEEHLLNHHYMKYNLRFYWPSGGRASRAEAFEDVSASYIRPFSNIASYQLDRNVLEAELLERNLSSPRFRLLTGADRLDVALAGEASGEAAGLAEGDDHRVTFRVGHDGDGEERTVRARWVVDTTGRVRHLAKKADLARPNAIRHGAFFWWVDGLIDVERLSERSAAERRKAASRRHLGHLPTWMATNHFCGEGYWFWVIPLQGKTSLGLVFDNQLVDPSDVFSVDKAREWIAERYPMFADDLAGREVLDFGGFRSFSHDAVQTLSPRRWALAGEAGRFSDPLYSPGSDLIAVYNTLIVSAIEAGDTAEDAEERAARCRLGEQVMRAVYSAYVPGYAVSYDTLGDQETFSLKYTWELATYFAAYVFPFVNDLFTDRRFVVGYLRQFARLGPVNRALQELLSAFYQWKKRHRKAPSEPRYFDFMELATLARAEKTFYEVGVSVTEAKRILSQQVDGLVELARFLGVHAASVVLDDPSVRTNRRFVEAFDPETMVFDPDAFRALWADCRDATEDDPIESWQWNLDPTVLDRFRDGEEILEAAGAGAEEPALAEVSS
jgi:flavin-dependent dehydrogenase